MRVVLFVMCGLLLGSGVAMAAPQKKFLHDTPDLSKIYDQEEKLNKIKSKSKVKSDSRDAHYERQAELQGKEFESMFVAEMLRYMHVGVKPDPLFGGGGAEKTFQDMLHGERAKFIDLGIAKMVKEQLISLRKRNARITKH